MRDFEYEAPRGLAEALQLFSKHNGRAKVLAGGTDLIDHVRTGRLAPDLLIDVKKVPELNVLHIDSDGLRLGASVPCCDIYGNEDIVSGYSALVDSCRIIGGVQIQNRASVGGNLCNSGPAADSTPALIALRATCVIASADGEREVAVEDFCTGPGTNVLKAGEMLVVLRLPAPQPGSGSHYRRFIPRYEMDIAVVGVGAAVQLDDAGKIFVSARIGVGAVAPTPLYASEASESLQGQPVSDLTISHAADMVVDIIRPIDDMRGTKEFRRHVTGVLTRRVLNAAVVRARGQSLQYKIGQ